jgi:hypothetical protein
MSAAGDDMIFGENIPHLGEFTDILQFSAFFLKVLLYADWNARYE